MKNNNDDIFKCRKYLLERLESNNYRLAYPSECEIFEKLLILTSEVLKLRGKQ